MKPFLEKYKAIVNNFHETMLIPGPEFLPEMRFGNYWIGLGYDLKKERDECLKLLYRGEDKPSYYDTLTEKFYRLAVGKPFSREIAEKTRLRECVSGKTRRTLRELKEMGIELYILTNCAEPLVEWTLDEDARVFDGIDGNKVYCENGICTKVEIKNSQRQKHVLIDKIVKDKGLDPKKTLCVGKYPLDSGPGMDLIVVTNGNEKRKILAEDQGIPTIEDYSGLLELA